MLQTTHGTTVLLDKRSFEILPLNITMFSPRLSSRMRGGTTRHKPETRGAQCGKPSKRHCCVSREPTRTTVPQRNRSKSGPPAEVAQFQHAGVRVEQQVLWLDVPVTHTGVVDVGQTAKQLVHVYLQQAETSAAMKFTVGTIRTAVPSTARACRRRLTGETGRHSQTSRRIPAQG